MENDQNTQKTKKAKKRTLKQTRRENDRLIYKRYRPLTAWNYFWRIVLYAIPVIGWIFLLVHAIGAKNPNARCFARSFFCALLVVAVIGGIAFVFSEVDSNNPEETTPEETTPEITTPEVTTPEVTTPEVTTPEVTTPEVTTPEVTTPEVTTPEETTPEVTTPEDEVPSTPYFEPRKILAIGNSFSDDAMEHLAEILVGEGYTDFILGNLYIGGCSMDGHKARIDSGAKDYSFRVNTGSGWNTVKESIQYGLDYTDWDVVTIQQVSGYSGIPESYGSMQYIIDYVRNRVDPFVKIFFHMTWAYQSTSGHGDFAKYDKNQMTMYNAIVNTVQSLVVGNWNIEGYLPSGTAIQNLRTSYLGDTLTRDGYHLSYDIGRYTAALVWYKQLFGADLSDLTVVPQKYPLVAQHLPAIKEAVNNAIDNPFEITASTYAEREIVLDKMTDADRAYLKSIGLNPDDYDILDLGLVVSAYYNSTSNTTSNLVTDAGNSPGFIATKLFTVETMPIGSVINILSGYQYRLEGWQTLGVANALERRGNSTAGMIVDEALYEQYTYIAFNLSKTSGAHPSQNDFDCFRIYVPKAIQE